MSSNQPAQGELTRIVIVRFLIAVIASFILFFLPAGTFRYWQAWVYLAIIFGPMLLVLIYLVNKHPELLVRRMRMREKEVEQKLIVKLSYIPLLLTLLLPGFDRRFGWSNVPIGVIVVADVLVLLGYGLIFLVFRENRYASRIVEVEQEQVVISSGPYALIRHPMYLGSLVLYIFTSLALGSFAALVPALFTIPVILARIRNEERVLARDLEGYREYMQRTRYRLIPGIW